MAAGDIYEVSDDQTLFSQQIGNVYFYRQALEFVTTDPTKAQTLAQNWVAQMLDKVRAIQTPDVLHTRIRVRNLYNESDAYELSISLAGNAGVASTGQTTSPFDAYAFAMDGSNAAVRDGQKRIAGVDEGWVLDGALNPATYDGTAFVNAANAMAAPVTVGLIIPDNVFLPVVVKRIREGAPGAYTYRLPESSGEGVWSQIVVGLYKLIITSQVSRKIGVGI